MNTSKRIDWIDCAKAIGIVLVVYGHTYDCWAIKWLYTFHMPLFFFCAGLTFKGEYETGVFLKKKAKGLLLPYALYSILRVIWLSTKAAFGGNLTGQTILTYICHVFVNIRDTEYTTGLWFLPLLFLSECFLFGMVKTVKTTGGRVAFVTGSIIIGYVYASYIGQPLVYGFDAMFIAMPFMYLGFLWKNCIGDTGITKRKTVIALALLVNVTAGIINYRIIDNRVDMYYCRYGNIVFYMIASCAGILGIILLSQSISRVCSVKKVLLFLGKNTIHIYCLHQILIDILRILIDKANLFDLGEYVIVSHSVNTIITVCVLILCVIWVKVLSEIKYRING